MLQNCRFASKNSQFIRQCSRSAYKPWVPAYTPLFEAIHRMGGIPFAEQQVHKVQSGHIQDPKMCLPQSHLYRQGC
jgi:hypothetical protein